MTRAQEIYEAQVGRPYRSSLDLTKAYLDVDVDEESQDCTTFVCQFGTFKMLKMALGLKGAPATFQAHMERALGDQNNKCAWPYLDDVLASSETAEEQETELCETIVRIADAGGRLNAAKCKIGHLKLPFLGNVLDGDTLTIDPEKVHDLLNMATPSSKAEVVSLLGLFQFFHAFIPRLSEKTCHLRARTKKKAVWPTDGLPAEAVAEIEELKCTLASEPILALYHPNRDVVMKVDGSLVGGFNALLLQPDENDCMRLVAAASRSLTSAERNHSAPEVELGAIIFALQRFRVYLLARHFTIETDHASLVWLVKNEASCKSGKLQRWVAALRGFDFDIVHRAGVDNIADAGSRLTQPANGNADAERDAFVDSMLSLETTPAEGHCNTMHPSSNEISEAPRQWFTLAELDSMPPITSSTPDNIKQAVLRTLHEEYAHVRSVKKMVELARAHNVSFPGVYGAAKLATTGCESCQRMQPEGAIRPPTMHRVPANFPMATVALDLFGPLPSGESFLSWRDQFSGFTDAALMKNGTTTAEIITELDHRFALFGVPGAVITDNGTQFVSQQMKDYFKRMNITHRTISSQRPQSNGGDERTHRDIKSFGRSILGSGVVPASYEPLINKALKGVNMTWSSAINDTPYGIMFGRDPPIGAASSPTRGAGGRARVASALQQRKLDAAKRAAAGEAKPGAGKSTLIVGDLVLYRLINRAHKMDAHWIGPFTISAVLSDINFAISDAFGTTKVVHIAQLKHWNGSSTASSSARIPIGHAARRDMLSTVSPQPSPDVLDDFAANSPIFRDVDQHHHVAAPAVPLSPPVDPQPDAGFHRIERIIGMRGGRHLGTRKQDNLQFRVEWSNPLPGESSSQWCHWKDLTADALRAYNANSYRDFSAEIAELVQAQAVTSDGSSSNVDVCVGNQQ
jgi:hypothetical protein